MTRGYGFRVQAIDKGAVAYFKKAGAKIPHAMAQVAARLEIFLPELITALLLGAAREAGSKAFPPTYTIGLLHAIGSNDVYKIRPSGVSVDIYIDLGQLGTYGDLSKGFHYHALKNDGSLVELPWNSGALDNSLANDTQKRYEFWKQVAETTGLYDDTINARMAVWGDKAPQWLLLQYGTNSDPVIKPQPILEDIQGVMEAAFQYIAREELYAAVAEERGYAPTSFDTFPEQAMYEEGRTAPDRIYKISKMNEIGKFASTYIGGIFAAKTAEERAFWVGQFQNLRGAEYSTFRHIFKRASGGDG